MQTKESIRVDIKHLITELASNGMYLRMAGRSSNVTKTIDLLMARTEILKSIAHRQGILIEAYHNESLFRKDVA